MDTPFETPLDQVTVKCCRCDFSTTADRINADKERFHSSQGIIRFLRNRGLRAEEIAKLGKMAFLCETCHEDDDDPPW